MHSGTCEERGGDYFGPAANRTARLQAVAHGGQIVVSAATLELARGTLPSNISLRDLGEHHLKDLSRPVHVFQVCAEGLPPTFPPLRSLDNPALRHNLPEHRTSFVGRSRELATLRTLLGESRMVTVAGPGGVGKTRAALQVAAEMLDGSGDGVWFVDLTPLRDPALVAVTVAEVLGVREQPGHPMLDTLVESVRDRELLAVLDNCEHVVDAAAAVAGTLVRRCPRVAVLATSREALGVGGERIYRMPPLTVPDESDTNVDRAAASEAVQLFVERATEHRPSFTLTAANAATVATVVRRLDGIPLALELAAARLRSLSVAELASRLDQRLRLLGGGSRTAPAHQRTLRALIDWSYDLLSPVERVVLERSSVFSGGFDLAAAEAVCTGVDGEESDAQAVDVITALVDKSLVQTDDRGEEIRYRLLETVREYAWTRLGERGTGEIAAVRRPHREHYLALAERAAPQLQGEDQVAWLDRLDAEHDNMRAALSYCLDDPDPEPGLRLATALSRFRAMRGHGHESLATLEAHLDRADARRPTLVRGRALGAAAQTSNVSGGDYAGAITRSEEALAIARAEGDRRLEAVALRETAQSLHLQGRFDGAVEVAAEGVLLARQIGDAHLLASLLRVRAGSLMCLGTDTTGDLSEALELFRRSGDRDGAGVMLGNIAVQELVLGRLESAREHLHEALTISRELGNPRQTVIMSINLGLIAHLDGDDAAARRWLWEALEEGRRLRDRECALYALNDIALTLSSSGEADEAARLHGTVAALQEELGEQFDTFEHRLRRADLERLRAALGEERFASAFAAGRVDRLDDVLSRLLDAGDDSGAREASAGMVS